MDLQVATWVTHYRKNDWRFHRKQLEKVNRKPAFHL